MRVVGDLKHAEKICDFEIYIKEENRGIYIDKKDY